METLVDALTEFHASASSDDYPTTPRDLITMLRLFTRWVRTFRTEHANSFGVISSGLDSLNDAETAVEEARIALLAKQDALKVKETKVGPCTVFMWRALQSDWRVLDVSSCCIRLYACLGTNK